MSSNIKPEFFLEMLLRGTNANVSFAAQDSKSIGKDTQPNSFKNLYKGTKDRGGVHINCGIPNRAFYLSAVGIGGFSWEVAGQIWYQLLISKRLSRDVDIPTFANLTIEFAGTLYNESIADHVRKAWETVDVSLN
jgi:Zn-dependent metalloprotease